MPATSISQQQAAGAALAAKRGEISASDLQGASKEMYDSMSADELEKFASTKHAGLPDKVEGLDEALKSIAETIASLDEDRKKKYQAYFNDKLRSSGYKNVKSIPKSNRGRFYIDLDKGWKSLDEMLGTSAATPGYETPNAFTGGKSSGENRRKHIATQLGYKIVGEGEVEERDTYRESMYNDHGTIEGIDDNELNEMIKKELASALTEITMESSSPSMMYNSKDIFTDGKNIPENRRKVLAKQSGMDVVEGYREIDVPLENIKKEDTVTEAVNVNLNPTENVNYTPKQQFGHAVREIRNNLSEVEKLVRRTLKMKNESGLQSEDYGKRAYAALSKINEKVNKLMQSLQHFK